MPIYEYRCRNGHEFEVMQRMADDPLGTCTECGAPAERVLHAPAIHFKGSGFHNTDYGKRKKSGVSSSDNGSSSESPSDSDSGSSKSSDSDSGSKKSSDSGSSKSSDSGSSKSEDKGKSSPSSSKD